ncbi:MAG TPA: TonB-dependent receptor [Azospirillaceae bacterium]|nr:TonB-dependent receptor [Azospirillaceae bacterium]
MRSPNYRNVPFRSLLLSGAACAAALVATPALAQETGALEEIVVTGSRIARQDYVSNSPVTTVNAEAFQQAGALTPENFLNTLPQVSPDVSSGSNNPDNNGRANINLRGLGSERNLVLLNGRRVIPGDNTGSVDVNIIPTALVERVEVISGGASAVYGADAVAGVVNFILKDDFEGAEADIQYTISEKGDGEEKSAYALLGGNFAGGKGNAVINLGWAKRDAIGKGERSFSAQADSTTSYFPSGSYVPSGLNLPTQASVDAVFGRYNVGAGLVARNGSLSFNPDGTLFAVGNTGAFDVQNFKGDQADVATRFFPNFFSFNFEPQNKLILPLERTSASGFATYKINDWIEVYSQVLYANYTAQSSSASSPAPTGTNSVDPGAGVFFSVPVTNPFIPNDLRQILATRTGDDPTLAGTGAGEDFRARKRFNVLGPRDSNNNFDVYQALGGLRGELPNGWNWDVYAANGKTSLVEVQRGNVSVSAVERLLDAADGGRSLCSGGFNPFGKNELSTECQQYVGRITKNYTTFEQDIVEGTLSGDLFELPAGAVGFAVGALYYSNRFNFEPDSLLSSGDVAGFNAEDPLAGFVDNTDLFGELLIPIVKDLPFAQSVNFTGGFRYSDHSSAGTFPSYKGEMDWQIVDPLRLRGSYQRAVRAPNIFELFSPQNEDNPQVDDPCNFDSDLRRGANAQQVRQLCIAQGIPAAIVDNFTQFNAQIDALQGGNPNLREEKADTFTIGTVITSPAEGFLERFSLSVDYYNISIKGAIEALSPDTILAGCFNADGTNPTYDVNNVNCRRFGRTGTGEINNLLGISENLGAIKTSGIDTQLDWGTELPDGLGEFSFNGILTWVDKFRVQEVKGQPFLEYVKSIGDDPGDAIPEWKAALTGTYLYGPAMVQLRARYIGEMRNENVVTDPTSTDAGVPSTWYFDTSASYEVTENFSIRAGVNNLFDQKVRSYPDNVDATTDPSTYDTIGRRYFVGATVKF